LPQIRRRGKFRRYLGNMFKEKKEKGKKQEGGQAR